MSKDKTISGYAATFRKAFDRQGEIIARSAFKDFVKDFKQNKRTIPLLFDHNDKNIGCFIGKVYDLEEDSTGLKFYGRFDNTPEGNRARELALDGRITGVSISYDIVKARDISIQGKRGKELQKLWVHEISLVLHPADQQAIITDVKTEASDRPEALVRYADRVIKHAEKFLMIKEADTLIAQ